MISCVIPAYEQIDLVRVCLASAQAQTGVDLEIVVSDDSRAGEIAALVRAAALTDPRIRYLVGPRTGRAADNWNRGLDAARGELAVVLHQDEAFTDPAYLRDAADLMARGGLRAVIAGTAVTGVTRPSRFALAAPIARRLPWPVWWLPAINWIGPTAAFVFRRGPRFDPDLVQLADVAFYRQVLRGGRWAFLGRPCVASLGHHPDQITARIDPHALARAELKRLAERSPPAIGPGQRAVASLLTRLRSRGG